MSDSCDPMNSIFSNEYYSIIWIYFSLFIHSSTEEYLHYFQVLAIIYKPSIHPWAGFIWTYVFNYLINTKKHDCWITRGVHLDLWSCLVEFDSETPWNVALWTPLSMVILQARILEWVATPSSGDLPNPGIELRSPALQVGFLTSEPPGKPRFKMKTAKLSSKVNVPFLFPPAMNESSYYSISLPHPC